VPPSKFTLEAGDEVTIAVEGIGVLVNPVVRLPI
jgi:2-keto-4-pentenoate hydratase/2-oxohepta-3-ene-1,7-dioic acid hydratase in catechol pathway